MVNKANATHFVAIPPPLTSIVPFQAKPGARIIIGEQRTRNSGCQIGWLFGVRFKIGAHPAV